MFFIHVVRGRPGGRLQVPGGGSKMAWLASALYSNYNIQGGPKIRTSLIHNTEATVHKLVLRH